MKLYIIPTLMTVFSCSAMALGADVPTTQPRSDPLSTGLQTLRQMQDDYRWSSIKGTQDALITDSDKVINKYRHRFELDRAGEAFRFTNDQHYFANDVGDEAFPMLARFTFDGKIVRTIGQQEGGPAGGTIGIYELNFLSALSFWHLMGQSNTIDPKGIASYLESRYVRFGGILTAHWLDADFDKLQIYGAYGDERDTIVLSVRNGLLLQQDYQRGDWLAISEITSQTQTIDQKLVPKQFVRNTRMKNTKNVITYDFTDFRLLKPQDVNVAELVKLTPEVGTEIVDGIEHVSYRVTATGKEYLPLYNPQTGKTTVGPATVPK